MWKESHGNPQLKLTDLDGISQEAFLQLKPIFVNEVKILESQDQQRLKLSTAQEVIALENPNQHTKFVIDRINEGGMTIGQITSGLSHAKNIEKCQAIENVRDIFMRMVHLKICVPSNYIKM